MAEYHHSPSGKNEVPLLLLFSSSAACMASSSLSLNHMASLLYWSSPASNSLGSGKVAGWVTAVFTCQHFPNLCLCGVVVTTPSYQSVCLGLILVWCPAHPRVHFPFWAGIWIHTYGNLRMANCGNLGSHLPPECLLTLYLLKCQWDRNEHWSYAQLSISSEFYFFLNSWFFDYSPLSLNTVRPLHFRFLEVAVKP